MFLAFTNAILRTPLVVAAVITVCPILPVLFEIFRWAWFRDAFLLG